MSDLNEILNSPEYFYCEKLNCKLRIEICVQRQKTNQNKKRSLFIPFPGCEGCSLGSKNMVLIQTERAMEPGKPKRGKGQRYISCDLYSDCLDLAAKKDWKTFNCESCPHYNTDPVEKKAAIDNKRLCEDCGKNPTMSPKHRYCPSCMGKKAHEVRKAKKNGPGKQNKENATYDLPKAEKSSSRGDLELIISFGKYETILREVEELAEKELRPIDLQVIYMLKKSLNNTNTTNNPLKTPDQS